MIERNEWDIFAHVKIYLHTCIVQRRKIQISFARELSTAEIYIGDENFYENEEPRYTDKKLRESLMRNN